jgi:predicted RNA-binding protein with RPS1 domain
LEWSEIKKDMVVSGKVVRLEKFGVFVDIGAERPGLVHISEMTHDFIRTPGDVVKEGDVVEVKVLDVIKPKKQIKLSMKALQDKPEDVVKAALEKTEKKEQHQREKDKVKEPEQVEGEKEVVVPTAMEMALREAMERKGVDNTIESVGKKRKRKNLDTNAELETIFSRTLKTRSPK